jgi:hypothetical protein
VLANLDPVTHLKGPVPQDEDLTGQTDDAHSAIRNRTAEIAADQRGVFQPGKNFG